MKTIIISLVAIIVVFTLTQKVGTYLEEHSPEAARKLRVENVPVVEVMEVQRADLELPLMSEGVVRTRRQTVLSAQVSGRIVEVHAQFEEGGRFQKGAVIAKIDRLDYETAVAQAESTVAEAKLMLAQEEARGVQAARDWKRIGGGKEASEMVLRLPFLRSARARVVAAEAALEKAREDLERTVIRAPFDCRVREVNLNLGAVVAAGSQIGMIYDAENLMIRLPFSLDDYGQIPADFKGVSLSFHSKIGGRPYEWQGEVMWDLGELEQATASAILLASVLPNEGQDERFRLPSAGQFLKARLSGLKLTGVVALPRAALRGRERVGILNEKNQLNYREVKIVKGGVDLVYVSEGIENGEKLILTKLELAVEGMTLKEANKVRDTQE